MKNKKVFLVFISFLMLLISACGGKSPFGNVISQHGRNIYRDYYDDNFKCVEDEIKIDKKTKEIELRVKVVSGIIDITIKNKDKEGREFNYIVDDFIEEKIDISKKEIGDNWVAIIKKDENTEGSIQISTLK